MAPLQAGPDIAELINRGGIHYGITGSGEKEILRSCIEKIHLPPSLDPEALLRAMLEREDLMPTSVGNGIAIPHPRSPLISNPDEQFVAVCFLKEDTDWKALDSKPVTTLILIVSASTKEHLQILSGVSFLCQQESFRRLLKDNAPGEEILAAVRAAEETWG
ncbi:PTS sugar transporter subunit IIA [Breznakiella homolactica]|uniref:PTS sugar transporter subunit IIA n=1 Tax=Breznakiella homolactica TaxID=2798577 RepID=A0A7T8BBX8_9SPIR|nr:PTS sugar transporter subunit IIA [Breznakiella homolactica]QQO09663.1 PTS sugar transporter subunit IIA [Breznakiella homolactica]